MCLILVHGSKNDQLCINEIAAAAVNAVFCGLTSINVYA